MERSRFIISAPRYYALAIVSHFLRTGNTESTRNNIVEDYTYQTNPRQIGGLEPSHIENITLFFRAAGWLTEQGVIEALYDDFGPPIFRPTENFQIKYEQLCERRDLPFYKFHVLRENESWLRAALAALERDRKELDVQDDEYVFDTQMLDQWEPIPLDQNEPALQAVIEAVDDVVQRVRSDNGYAATYPEERNYVLEQLSGFGGWVKQHTTISLPVIQKKAIEPLTRAAKSLGRSAAGLALEVAKARIKEWLMKVGIPWPLDW